ncbi:transmembrane protein 185B isoform X3 [Diorhabda carinulata]|uniref:transmembrane protein 185B isoform X3 n=1 Tax=Diorhabda carinulata TaxID=1163345 RepID=UPI0025A1D14B|nr:transmembrane protein 185B isoform X3 [Diorhabda carinulata]
MNLQTLFQDFNPSKFVVHTCLLVFTILFSLKLDNYVSWSFWTVFTPIWVWKVLVITGATVGSYVWWRYPHFSIAVCIWAVKHDRSFELELFCAVNVLQFIFLALRLDGFISWSWEVVFVPLWIVMCLSLVNVGVLYTIIFAAILLRTPEVSAQQRRSSVHSAVGYTFLVIPILVFQVLLADKLDDDIRLSYTAVVSPLFISFITLILMSFSAKGGNKWWFGMRKDFCSFVLGACPLLQEYANIAYHSERRTNGVELESQPDFKEKIVKRADLMKPIVPIISIEIPD